MTSPYKYFFDLPVYRIKEDAYVEQQQEYIEKAVFPPDSPDLEALKLLEKNDPDINTAYRSHAFKSYGGIWRYNEIIGYIRLYFLGDQIRGEYYAVNKKRIMRSRTKQLEHKTWKLAPELDIEDDSSSEKVLESIEKYIEDCMEELPRRYIDTSGFDAIAKYTDWKSLYDA
jgi:hypothetical protein